VRQTLSVKDTHSYKYVAYISAELQKRQEGLPKEIVDIVRKAQVRLCQRYSRLMQQGKHCNLVVTAFTREIIAFF
jgi:transposase